MIANIIRKIKSWGKKPEKKPLKKKKSGSRKVTLFNCKASQVDHLVKELGANVNQTNKYGKTPLFYTSDKMKIIKLISNGADIHHIDPKTGLPPVFNVPLELVPLYLKAGYDPKVKYHDKESGWYYTKLLSHVVEEISSWNCSKYKPGSKLEEILLDLANKSHPQILDDPCGGSLSYLHSSTIYKILTIFKDKGVSLKEIIRDQGNMLPEHIEGDFLEIYLVGLDTKVSNFECSADEILEYDKKNFAMLHNEGFSLDGVLNVTLRDSRYLWFTDYTANHYKQKKELRNKDVIHVMYSLATSDLELFEYFMNNHFYGIFIKEDFMCSGDVLTFYYRLLFEQICKYSKFEYNSKSKPLEKITLLLSMFKELSNLDLDLLEPCKDKDDIIKHLIDLDININIVDDDNVPYIDSVSDDCQNHYKAHLAKKEKALIEEFITPDDDLPKTKKRKKRL